MRSEDCLRYILTFIGENPDREGLKDTPKRIKNSWDKLYGGYKQDVESILTIFNNDGSDEVQYDQIVLLKNIEFYSTCEHHMLPFFGQAHVAYIPHRKVVGISKLARLLEVYARRLQIQERIGDQVTAAINKYLQPKGAACILQAQHFCMTSRGIQKQNSVMITSSLTGCFMSEQNTRQELMNLIKM